jgi:hypothetical protein
MLEVADAATVTVTTATTPLAIVLPFMPLAIHVEEPLVVLQVIAFPAAVEAAPLAILTEVIAVEL